MTQNTSPAVMQQRSEPHDSFDDFPTPPWATRALCEMLPIFQGGRRASSQTVREPAANRGHMVRPLREYFARVEAADIHEALWQLFKTGPTWDGNLVSKEARTWLVDNSLAFRTSGYNALTVDGVAMALSLGMGQRKDKVKP